MKNQDTQYHLQYKELESKLKSMQATLHNPLTDTLIPSGDSEHKTLVTARLLVTNILYNAKTIQQKKPKEIRSLVTRADRFIDTYVDFVATLQTKIEQQQQQDVKQMIDAIQEANVQYNAPLTQLVRQILNDTKLSSELEKVTDAQDQIAIIADHYQIPETQTQTLMTIRELYEIKPTLLRFYQLLIQANQKINLYETQEPDERAQTLPQITELHQQITAQLDELDRATQHVQDANALLQQDIPAMDALYERRIFTPQARMNFLTPGSQAAKTLKQAIPTLPSDPAKLSDLLNITQNNTGLSFDHKMLFKHVLKRAFDGNDQLSKTALSDQLSVLSQPVAWTPPGKTRARNADITRLEAEAGTHYLTIGEGLEVELRNAGASLADSAIPITEENLKQQLLAMYPTDEEDRELLNQHIQGIFQDTPQLTISAFQRQLSSMNHDIIVYDAFEYDSELSDEDEWSLTDEDKSTLAKLIDQMADTIQQARREETPLHEIMKERSFRSEVRRLNALNADIEQAKPSFYRQNRLREQEGLTFKLSEQIQQHSGQSLNDSQLEQQLQLACKLIQLLDLRREAKSILKATQTDDMTLSRRDTQEKLDTLRDSPLMDDIMELSQSHPKQEKLDR